MEKTVLDSIDRPIRPLIIELNRIGLRTKFCCCGFPYRGEEEMNFSRLLFKNKKDLDAFIRVRTFVDDLFRHVGYSYSQQEDGTWLLVF